MRLWIGSILVLAGATSLSAPSLYPFEIFLQYSAMYTNILHVFVCVLAEPSSCVRADYADPGRTDCHTSADGINCDDEADEQCDSALFLSIQAVDRSVHILPRDSDPQEPFLGPKKYFVGIFSGSR